MKVEGKVCLLAVAALGVAVCGISQAGSIYAVNLGPFGLDGATVAGTIQTDGTTGTLAASNITAWNFVVSDGIGDSFYLSNLNSTLTMTGTATTAAANTLQFNFDTPNDGNLGYFEVLDSSSGWGWDLAAPSSTCCIAVLSNTAAEPFDEGLYSLNPQPLTMGTSVVPVSLPGGPLSSPVFLISSVSEVTGTIGPGGQDYYSFYWPGGIFSATATVTGASSGADYAFTFGYPGTCYSAASTLYSGDSFTGTLSFGLAPGQYCIGIQDTSSPDPNYALVFNTPVGTTPEPSGMLLLSAGLGLMSVGGYRKRRRSC